VLLEKGDIKVKLIKSLVIITTLVILSFNPLLARAETFVELYAGMSLGADEVLTFMASGEKAAEEADLNNSFTIGYRMGYWFKSLRWAGVALEASHFKLDIRQKNIDRGHLRVIPVSGLLMFRMPLLKRDIYPEGEYLFYGGIGPGIFLTSIKYEVANSPITDMSAIDDGLSGRYSDRTADIGLDIHGGIAKMVRANISIFCEYRYTKFDPKFEEDIGYKKVKIETEIETHHALIGLTYYYN
jgi:opacity protein-like surface antigen